MHIIRTYTHDIEKKKTKFDSRSSDRMIVVCRSASSPLNVHAVQCHETQSPDSESNRIFEVKFDKINKYNC